MRKTMRPSPVSISLMRHAGVLVALVIAIILSAVFLVISALTTPLPAEAHAPGVVLSGAGIQCGDTSASLTGQSFGGQAIGGSDSVNTVGCR